MNDKERARIKLASTYLAIIMAMSVVFSFVLYNASSNQLDRSFRQIQSNQPRNALEQAFDELRKSRLDESRAELQKKVLLFNATTLLFGAAMSYILAREALRPLEETLEAQERFTSDASHELRTPLTAMRSEIEVALRDKKLSAKDSREILESNLEEITKLEALTNGLLLLARQEHNETVLEPTSLKSVITTAVSSVQAKAKDRHIKIDTKTVQDLRVRADAQTVTQVVIILLDNAVKYSPDKSTVKISTFSTRNSRGFIIKDSGVGIPKEDMPHVFDRFYRSDTSRAKTGSEGYGLGLAIAKQIVDLHKGNIELTSQTGKGTSAKVSLLKA